MIRFEISEDDWMRLVLYLGYATGAANREGEEQLANRMLDLYSVLSRAKIPNPTSA